MTTVARLAVDIGANTGDLDRGLQRSDQRLANFGRNVGRVATAIGGSMLGIGTWATYTAIEWESAFADIEKTVSGTDSELATLGETLRDMASSGTTGALADAHTTLAAIAATAGQLGIATDDIAGFTETIAAMTVATNLTADEAANFAARFANVVGLDVAQDMQRLGDTIVTLGNNMATTEADITSFAGRMSALATFGFDPQNILAYGAAMSSLGLTAELGSTNFVKSVSDMVTAVSMGGDDLKTFAEVAGMTADEFSELANSNPEEAMNAFIEGLAGMDASEQLATLNDLNITGTEQQRVLMTLAEGYDTVSGALTLAEEGWAGNNALMTEAAAKADTTQGNINQLRNSLNDLGITIGDKALPGVNKMVDGLQSIVDGNFGAGLAEIATGITQIVDGFTGQDFTAGINSFLAAMNMLPQVSTAVIGLTEANAGLGLGLIALTPYIGSMTTALMGKVAALGLSTTAVSGLAASMAAAAGPIIAVGAAIAGVVYQLGQFNEQVGQPKEAAAEIVQREMISGNLTREELDQRSFDALSANFGGGVFGDVIARTFYSNVSDALQGDAVYIEPVPIPAENLVSMPTAEDIQSEFGAEMRDNAQRAIENAFAEGDFATVQMLTPIANELEIDIAQIQADLQAEIGAQPFNVTVTANMSVMPGAVNMSTMNVPMSTGNPVNVTLNTYGTNPRQTADQLETAAGDRGRGGTGRR